MKRKIVILIIVLAAVLASQWLFLTLYKASLEHAAYINYSNKTDEILRLDLKQDSISEEAQRLKMYELSGKNVYERVFNSKVRDIPDLIREITLESVPREWKVKILTEEFTNTLLMLNTNIRRPQLEQVLKYLKPIMPYLSEYLKNIAIYDSNNQCCLYFDEQSINYLLKNGNINQSESDRLKQNAEIFKTYNDYKIQLKYENGHYYAIVVVIGKNASTEVMMMLDTGATKSMISEDVALKTGSETLSSEQMMYFQTANGLVKYPLVKRRLVLEDTGKDLEISVNTKDNINLLGMDFLKDCSIDSQERCIYVKIKAEE